MLIYMPHRHTWAEGVLNRPPVPSTLVVVQSLSRIWLFVTLWTAAHQASLSFIISRSLLNSCPLSQWYHPTISASAFSSCPQSFPASGSFPMSWLFVSGGQSIGASASASALVLPMSIEGWFPWWLIGLIFLQNKRLKNLLQHHNSKPSILYMATGKAIALTRQTFVSKVISAF